MADTLFEFIAGRIQEQTELDQLEARGTLRIALKEAGLDPRNVTSEQMAVMLEKTMPRELLARGVDNAEPLCRALVTSLKSFQGQAAGRGESPEDVFRRLGGR
ncbi:MAG TPA: hypothetical protein VNL37_06725 [Candidatus Polarisedimenticolia bacterium]|nr:hypothetical protein [Candidatus Polarisedimenticolia bacterium]